MKNLKIRNNRSFSHRKHCYLHECASNVYAQILNKPPLFQVRPPPNPLNFGLTIEGLFHKDLLESTENEQFLLYYLNLNENLTSNYYNFHSDSYADKCTDLRLYQIASATTYSLTNKYAFKNVNKDFSLKNFTSNLITNKSIRLEINNEISNNSISFGNNSKSNANNFLLFSSISLVAISIIFLLFYLYYHYFYLR